MSAPTWSVRRVHALDDAQIDQLADVLIDCVDGGASVSFMHPLTRARAVAFWHHVARGVAAGDRALLVAEDPQGLCGTVQLGLDQPENQPHRADLSKMLVHRRARRRGLGAALMRAAERTARACGKTLLVLDAVTGGEGARLYQRLGWVRVGEIPGYALLPRAGLCSTTVYYRSLERRPGSPSPGAIEHARDRVSDGITCDSVHVAESPGHETAHLHRTRRGPVA
jgi:GNAT superfamily N-acetyltransferase